jgi:hypothetical protein
MMEVVVDIGLSNELLRRGNTLGRTLGDTKLRGLTSSHDINLEIGEYSVTLGRSGQNLEALYRHILDQDDGSVPYDQLTIIRGDDADTQILATGSGLCLSTAPSTIDNLAHAAPEKNIAYNTLTIGQIALLQHRNSPGGGDYVVADPSQTFREIDAFLAQ